jgi:hypothetical protein
VPSNYPDSHQLCPHHISFGPVPPVLCRSEKTRCLYPQSVANSTTVVY